MRLPHRIPGGATAALFALALALRLLLLAESADAPYAHALVLDAEEYQHLARGLLHGTWSQAAAQTYVHGILYPAVWAVVEACGGGVPALLVLQALLGAATCVLIGVAAGPLLGTGGARLSAALAAGYWPFLLFGVQPLATTLVVFLVSAVFAWTAAPPPWSARRLAGTGLLLALVGATRANALLLVPVFAWQAAARQRAAGRPVGRGLGLLAAGLVVGLTPFLAHNLATQGTPLPFEGAWSFHMGFNPQADGTPYARQGIDWQRLESIGYRDGWDATAAQRGRVYLTEGLGFIAGQPLAALRLVWAKVRLFLNAFEVPVSVDLAWYDRHTWLGRALPFTFGVLAPLALVGMVDNRRRWREWAPAYGGVAAFLVSGVLFTVCARYRLPAVPFLLPFAADTLLRLWRLGRSGPRRQLLPRLVLLAGAVALVHTGVDPARVDHLRPDWLRGELLLQRGEPHQAEAAFLRADAAHPGDPDVHNSLGAARERLGDAATAEARYRQALALAPDHSRAAINLARLLGRTGRPGEGAALAEGVLRTDPRPRMQHEAQFCLAMLRLQAGDAQGAYDRLQTALAIVDEPQARYALANVCHQLGRLDEERAQLEAAVRLAPDFAAAQLNLGSLCLLQGDLAAAERALKQAVALEPRSATAHAHLGLVYQRTGRPQLAQAALDQARRLRAGIGD